MCCPETGLPSGRIGRGCRCGGILPSAISAGNRKRSIRPAKALGTMRRLSGEMVQALFQPDVSVSVLLERLSHLTGALRVTVDPHDPDGWIQADALMTPETGALADFIVRLADAGFGANRRAAAASLLLRHGWAAGPIIAAYLAERRTLRIHDFALRFSASTLVEGVWIRQADLRAGRGPAGGGPGGRAGRRAGGGPGRGGGRRGAG